MKVSKQKSCQQARYIKKYTQLEPKGQHLGDNLIFCLETVCQFVPYLWPSETSTLCNVYHMSLVVRKPAFCICENKDPDQFCGNREADQRLCFRYTDPTIPLLSKSEISSL